MSKPTQDSVLESNRVAGTRLELLLFRLESPQVYGINVFKVQEAIHFQQLTAVPGANPLVNGIATLRGKTMPIIDLSRAIGGPPLRDPKNGYIIITEYNRSVHGFLVKSVERIVNTRWDQVQPPSIGTGRNSFVTAVTIIDGKMIEILDVEKVLDQVVHAKTDVSADLTKNTRGTGRHVLVVDDSSVARNQIRRSLEQLGIECTLVKDGREAITLIDDMIGRSVNPAEHFTMVISDIEMPEVDGYQLTSEIRRRPQLAGLYVLLHSSISGVFNVDMVKKTGANKFIQKYHPDDLARAVLDLIGNG